jgi:ribosome-binding factor A
MMVHARAERVAGQVQKVISDLLRRSIRDPRLAGTTVTGVKMTADLRIARVYFTTPKGADSVKQASDGFQSALGFVKRQMARELKLKYMPDLQFHYDASIDYGQHIDQLLKKISTDHDTDHSSS